MWVKVLLKLSSNLKNTLICSLCCVVFFPWFASGFKWVGWGNPCEVAFVETRERRCNKVAVAVVRGGSLWLQAHTRSHQHMGSSLVQWLWATTFPFYSFFPKTLSPFQSLPVCLCAAVHPCSAAPKGALSVPFPYPQNLFGSMSMLPGKHSYRQEAAALPLLVSTATYPYSSYLYT